jgi:predicted enzyme related to lactoylglutathione lyase
MRAETKEIMDEMDMTVAAIEDLKGLMQNSEEKAAGSQCLHILVAHLKEQMERLWMRMGYDGG